MNSTLKTLLNDAGLSPQGALQPLSGGDSAATYRLSTDAGDVVVKRDDPARLAGEADGLRALASANSSLIIPTVLAQEGEWLVMEALETGSYRHFSEVDLAMLTLFGSPGEAFFEAYWNGNAPADWPRREALFQLYPLLNHVFLFGGSYRAALEHAVIKLEAYQA
ncbi:fructosamine kinase family protein [Halomonas sp. AOP13-D3-9]